MYTRIAQQFGPTTANVPFIGAIKTCGYAVSLLMQVVTCSRNAQELEKAVSTWQQQGLDVQVHFQAIQHPALL